MNGTHFSEMRVANAASLALMLQERAEPSLLFLRARIAMILQILRTERNQRLLLHTALLMPARWRTTRYLAQTFVSARRSSAPSALCAPCLKGRGQSEAPGRLDRTLGSGQSSPQPTATNFTQAEAQVTSSVWATVRTSRLCKCQRTAYLWWVKRPEAYSNRRNSRKFDPKLHTNTTESHCQRRGTKYERWLIQIQGLLPANQVLTGDCETAGVCNDPTDLLNVPQTTSCWEQCWKTNKVKELDDGSVKESIV